jgi:hypothetical protein
MTSATSSPGSAGATVSDLPGPIWEMVAVHEALRKLGFRPDDIFATANAGGHVGILLRAQGLEFMVACGHLLDLTEESFTALWDTATQNFNREVYDPADLTRMYEQSWVYKHRTEFVAGLLLKGFRLPRSIN